MDIILTQFKPWNSNACTSMWMWLLVIQYRVRHNWHESPIEHYYMAGCSLSYFIATCFGFHATETMLLFNGRWTQIYIKCDEDKSKMRDKMKVYAFIACHTYSSCIAYIVCWCILYALHAICGQHNEVGASIGFATAFAFTLKLIKNMSETRALFFFAALLQCVRFQALN